MILLIPAYEPDEKLIGLLDAVAWEDPGLEVVVVDDGSSAAYGPVFADAEASGAIVLRHPVNRGKGAALRTGLAVVADRWPGRAVVCADCDGQHRPADIATVAASLTDDRTMVLGARQFTGCVPLRSRLGNALTRTLFAFATGLTLRDTQTGLRAYPAAMIPWLLTVGGDRFEYELSVLLEAGGAGMAIRETPIETVYLDENASSHFRPIHDSLRVYGPLVRFAGSSIAGFVTDLVMLLVLNALTGNLLFSVVGARAVSAAVNFALNRRFVFDARPRAWRLSRQARRYATLGALLLAANYLMLEGLHVGLGLGLVAAKVITEVLLFLASYRVQKVWVFGPAALPETRKHLASL